MGCDHGLPGAAVGAVRVSIHAPAWGATADGRAARRAHRGFNPRTRVGCDVANHNLMTSQFQFQSTHPRGVRPLSMCGELGRSSRFNPRTRVGCDHMDKGGQEAQSGFNPRTRVGCDAQGVLPGPRPLRVSIHAPAWGATTFEALIDAVIDVSIHAPAWGATGAGLGYIPQDDVFQSTHPRGVRHGLHHAGAIGQLFQSTHPRGVRPSGQSLECCQCRCFNPRTRVGCDVSMFYPVDSRD